jgi:CSLREA domain-containing protein
MIRNKILKRGAHPESEIQGCEKGRGRGRRVLVVVALAWLLTVAPLPWPVPSVMAATFTVNTTDDTADASPGDGVCADSAGRCSLRAAVMEANALGGGPHTIVLQAGQTYTLSKDTDGAGHRTDSGADNDDLDITSTIIIQGNGAVIQRDPSLPCNLDAVAEAGEFRIFHVQTGGSLTLDALTISNGCAGTTAGIFNDRGGAIFNINGIVNVINSTVSQNRAVYAGGGIFQYQGTLNIINSTISENYISGPGGGGGISAANGTVNINGSIIARNSSAADAGGIRTEGFDPIINVTNSTISGNSARYGGGIRHNDGQLNIINSTISGNSATDSGGGIWNGNRANLSFVTIANNSATSGGGISNNPGWGGIVKIKNSIVGNNTSGGDCTGTINASGVNFATDSSCGAGFTQVTSAQLNLGPLQVNPPGTTATHALLVGSAAIDAVTDCTDLGGNAVTQDQRGVARPQGPKCDAGAFEREVFRLYLPLVLRMR